MIGRARGEVGVDQAGGVQDDGEAWAGPPLWLLGVLMVVVVVNGVLRARLVVHELELDVRNGGGNSAATSVANVRRHGELAVLLDREDVGVQRLAGGATVAVGVEGEGKLGEKAGVMSLSRNKDATDRGPEGDRLGGTARFGLGRLTWADTALTLAIGKALFISRTGSVTPHCHAHCSPHPSFRYHNSMHPPQIVIILIKMVPSLLQFK